MKSGLLAMLLLITTTALAQSTGGAATAGDVRVVVPPLVKFGGALTDVSGKPRTGKVEVSFYLYEDQEGGAPLWIETQVVEADQAGRYTVTLGSNDESGLPSDIFASGQARWLAVQAQGQPEEPRVRLMSVPYALKAGDAETLGGLPASAFLHGAVGATASSATAALIAVPNATPAGGGTTNFVPLWTPNGATLGNSVIFQSGTGSSALLGINTSSPGGTLDVAGSTIVRGALRLPPQSTATSAVGGSSFPLALQASSFSSSTKSPVTGNFQLMAEPKGINTATPGASLNLLYGTTAVAETGLSIASNGQITFAPGQTFPGGTTSGNETIDGSLQAQFGSFTSSNTGDILLVQNLNATGGSGIVSTAAGSGSVGVEGNGLGTGATGVEGQGSTNNGTGVLGKGNTGVAGTATTPGGIGVIGTGGSISSAFGVIGTSGGVGVSGSGNTTPGSKGIGVTGLGALYGVSGSSPSGTGVQGSGVEGVSGNGTDIGVIGEGSTGNAFSQGVAAIGQHQGLFAVANDPSGNHQGVFAQVLSPTGTGTLSVATGESNTGKSLIGCCAIGVWGDTNQATPGAAGLAGSADDAQAMFLGNNSVNHLTANINNYETTTHNVKVAAINGAFGSCTFDTDGNGGCSGRLFGVNGVTSEGEFLADGSALIFGNLSVDGSKSSVVPVDNGSRMVALYAVEAPENWFEDYGGGKLVDGGATITLEPVFLQTVNTGMEYRVFLTPKGDCEGLYVTNETPQGFEVHELRGGRSNVEFDYRILARRKGYENLRLQDRTEEHARARKQFQEDSSQRAFPDRKNDVMNQMMQHPETRRTTANRR